MQLTTRKAEYIVDLEKRVASGEPDLGSLGGRSNEDVIASLIPLRGLGSWTAEWFLARGLGRGDVCPAGDLAVHKAFAHFYNRGRVCSQSAMRRGAARWGSQQDLAVHYLLAGLRRDANATGGGT